MVILAMVCFYYCVRSLDEHSIISAYGYFIQSIYSPPLEFANAYSVWIETNILVASNWFIFAFEVITFKQMRFQLSGK